VSLIYFIAGLSIRIENPEILDEYERYNDRLIKKKTSAKKEELDTKYDII